MVTIVILSAAALSVSALRTDGGKQCIFAIRSFHAQTFGTNADLQQLVDECIHQRAVTREEMQAVLTGEAFTEVLRAQDALTKLNPEMADTALLIAIENRDPARGSLDIP